MEIVTEMFKKKKKKCCMKNHVLDVKHFCRLTLSRPVDMFFEFIYIPFWELKLYPFISIT